MTPESKPAKTSGFTVPMVGICFVIFVILEGLQRVSGLLFLETQASLDNNRLFAATPFALSRATALFVGVVVECYQEKLKPGTWIICGCLVSAAGIGICFLTSSILWWSVFWGIIFGSGVGIVSPTLVKELSQHENPKIALSLKSAGSSFGCVIFPFIIYTLIVHYGLNGSYAIFCGLILNCVPLTIISIYQMRFCLLRSKWCFRKTSKRYQMSVKRAFEGSPTSIQKSNEIKVLSKESFLCNLEPDTLEKVTNSEVKNGNQCEIDIDIFKPIMEAKRDMTTEKSSKTQNTHLTESIPKDSEREKFYKAKLTELVDDISNYEKNHMVYEQSFSSSDEIAETPIGSAESNISYLNIDEQKSKNQSHDSSSSVPTDASDKMAEKSNAYLEKKAPQQDKPSAKDENDNKKQIPNKTSKGKDIQPNIPFEIKVHVVECTVTTKETSQRPPPKRNGYRRHSNSLITACYDNVDFTKMFQHKNSKSGALHKLQCNLSSRMFLISEDDEFGTENQNSSINSRDIEAFRGVHTQRKVNPLLKVLYDLAKPSCLVILYTSVIFEFTLALLLLMFADFAKDNSATSLSANFVLVSFGLGGLVGQLTCAFGSQRLLVDGSHAASAIIFLLNGLAVAGILWSTNVRWLSGFYATLGFIESAILLTFPRLISEYIEKKSERALSWTCRCVSGAVILFVPYAIGFSRDEIGEYDGLLQVTSCLSVLCSVLCYFLPRIVTKQISELPAGA